MRFNKPLRLTLLGAALTLSPALLSSNAFAQQEGDRPATRPAGPGGERGRGGEGRGNFDPAARIDRFAATVNELKLTDEQKPKVESAVAAAKKALADLNANPPEGRERFQAMGKINNDMRDAVMAVLTDEQKTELRAKMPERGRGGPGGGDRGGFGGPGRILGELGLSDDQKAKVEAIQKDSREKMTALRDAGGDREASREKYAAIFQEQQKKIEEVLTPEQKEKYTKLMAEQRERMQQRGGPGGDRPGGERRPGGNREPL